MDSLDKGGNNIFYLRLVDKHHSVAVGWEIGLPPFIYFIPITWNWYTLDLIQADTRAISGKLGRVSFQFFSIFFFFSTKKFRFPDKLCGKQAFADRIDCSFFPARLTRQGSPDCHVNLVLDKCSMLKSIDWRLSFLFFFSPVLLNVENL